MNSDNAPNSPATAPMDAESTATPAPNTTSSIVYYECTGVPALGMTATQAAAEPSVEQPKPLSSIVSDEDSDDDNSTGHAMRKARAQFEPYPSRVVNQRFRVDITRNNQISIKRTTTKVKRVLISGPDSGVDASVQETLVQTYLTSGRRQAQRTFSLPTIFEMAEQAQASNKRSRESDQAVDRKRITFSNRKELELLPVDSIQELKNAALQVLYPTLSIDERRAQWTATEPNQEELISIGLSVLLPQVPSCEQVKTWNSFHEQKLTSAAMSTMAPALNQALDVSSVPIDQTVEPQN